MNEWGILAIYTSFLTSLPLFFVKRERTRRILLYTSLFLLAGGLVCSVTDFFWPPYKNIQASRYVQRLTWRAADLKYSFIPAIIALLFVTAANTVAKRRIVKHRPASDPQKHPDSLALIRLQKSVPMFGTFTIITIVFASLFGIAMLTFARQVMVEKYWYGPSVDLPEADYGASISYSCESMMITIDSHGSISTREKIVSLEELKRELANFTANMPRYENYFMDAQGEVYRDEYIHDCIIFLRVDADCPFHITREILDVLERQKIRWAYFRVAEPE